MKLADSTAGLLRLPDLFNKIEHIVQEHLGLFERSKVAALRGQSSSAIVADGTSLDHSSEN